MAERFRLERAMLPDGWAANVALTVEGGTITTVTPDAPPDGAATIPGTAIPGLPNLHSHTFQRAMAGLAEIRGPAHDTFWTWREVMYAFLARLTPDDIEAIAAQAMMEMLEGGFTAVAEFHYLHHAPDGTPYANVAEMAERIAAAAAETGIGLSLLPILYTHGGFGPAPATPGQRRFLCETDAFLALHDASRRALAHLPDAVLGAAPHSLRAATDEQITALRTAIPEGPLHIHVAEQVPEVEACLAHHGARPVQHLLATQPVDARWTLIHATHMTPDETAALSATGATAGLCPITEANLGDGVFDALRYAGPWGVGTDSNIEITAPGELRMLEYAQRLARRGRNLLARAEGRSTGEDLYRSALDGGAQACARRIGRLAPGHRADLVWLDPGTTPDEYVFVRGSRAVRRVMVAGRTLVEDGRHVGRDPIAARYAAVMARLRS